MFDDDDRDLGDPPRGRGLAGCCFLGLGLCAMLSLCSLGTTEILLNAPAGPAAELVLAASAGDALVWVAAGLGVGGGAALVVAAAGGALAQVLRAVPAPAIYTQLSGARARITLTDTDYMVYEDDTP